MPETGWHLLHQDHTVTSVPLEVLPYHETCLGERNGVARPVGDSGDQAEVAAALLVEIVESVRSTDDVPRCCLDHEAFVTDLPLGSTVGRGFAESR